MMSAYPRTRNGWVDDGSLIKASNRRDRCPNCGSSSYRETLSREECKSCGLVCDYWGGGTNKVYESYLARQHAADEERKRIKEEHEEREWRDSWSSDDD
jgi:hypothetical protein